MTLTAAVKTLTKDELVLFRSRYRHGASGAILLATSTVRAELTIEASAATKDKEPLCLWRAEHFVPSEQVKAGQPPKGLPLSTHLHGQQWALAKQWCLEKELPAVLFSPDAYRGVGESSLSGNGCKFGRRYAPTGD